MKAVPSTMDLLLTPVHRWVWSDVHRRARKLLRFAQTEADGGRDLSRAAELTPRSAPAAALSCATPRTSSGTPCSSARGAATCSTSSRGARSSRRTGSRRASADSTTSTSRSERDESLLAFLHLSEKAAAGRFVVYGEVLAATSETREVFARILEDEVFHMTYTRKQLARVAPRRQGLRLWLARAGRLWKAYLRIATRARGRARHGHARGPVLRDPARRSRSSRSAPRAASRLGFSPVARDRRRSESQY